MTSIITESDVSCYYNELINAMTGEVEVMTDRYDNLTDATDAAKAEAETRDNCKYTTYAILKSGEMVAISSGLHIIY